MKVLILSGLPGSGKSTWAKEYLELHAEAVIVNKDKIRDMLFAGQKWTRNKEKLTLEVRDSIIQAALDNDRTVIVDDTNLNPAHKDDITNLVIKMNNIRSQKQESLITLETKFFDVPLEECISRDSKREHPVGEKVIREMHDRWLTPKRLETRLMPKIFRQGLPNAVICDLDGTLAYLNGRDPYDASTCEYDMFNESVLHLLDGMSDNIIVFVSGREEKFREPTKKWLATHEWNISPLYMRPTGDFRKDVVIKEEIYNNHIKDKYNILFVLDDRKQCVDLWRSLGLTCLQVAEGNF